MIRLLVTCLSVRSPVSFSFFHNVRCIHMISCSTDEVPMWMAARSSGAAPTYFRPCGRYLDGGLISNNPTLDVLTEIMYNNAALDATCRSKEKVSPAVVVSLGTGAPPQTDITIIDVHRPDTLVGIAKMAFIATNLGQLLVDQVSILWMLALD